MTETRDDRPVTGGGHEVDDSPGDTARVKAADRIATPTTAHNVLIWVFVLLLVAVIALAVVGGLGS